MWQHLHGSDPVHKRQCEPVCWACVDAVRHYMLACAGIPYIFLLTDGAVENERTICRTVEAYQAREPAPGAMHARISTFAIGPFCNHFFLKQLAASGADRGLLMVWRLPLFHLWGLGPGHTARGIWLARFP